MIKQHYPLFIFTISVVVMLVAYFDRSSNTRQKLPSAHRALVSQDNPVTASPPTTVYRPPSLDAKDGIVWEISATAPLEKKLDSCDVILLNSEMPIRQNTRYYFRNSTKMFSLFTPVQAKRSRTVKNHLDTVRCLSHDSLSGQDPLTGRIVNAFTLSTIKDDDTIPLELFFKVTTTQQHTITTGLKRLGHSELRLVGSNPEIENLTWQLLGLMLTDRPLEILLDRTPALNHLVKTETKNFINLRVKPPISAPVQSPRPARSRPALKTSGTHRQSTPIRPIPRERPLLPDYR